MTADETVAQTHNRGDQQVRRVRVVDELSGFETTRAGNVSRSSFAVKRTIVVLVLLTLAALGSLFGGEVENQRQIAQLVASLANGVNDPGWVLTNNSYSYNSVSVIANMSSETT